MKEKYTFKEILLTLREEIIKNDMLINELNKLVFIDNSNISYEFRDILPKDENNYRILFCIEELQKRQNLLKRLIKKVLFRTNFCRASIPKYQYYDIIKENDKYKFNINYNNNFGNNFMDDLKILDEEKLFYIVDKLYHSGLSMISSEGIHISEDKYLEISQHVLLMKGHNCLTYLPGNDSMRIELFDRDFDSMLYEEIGCKYLSDNLIGLIDSCQVKDKDIELVDKLKKGDKRYYKFYDNGKKLILSRDN